MYCIAGVFRGGKFSRNHYMYYGTYSWVYYSHNAGARLHRARVHVYMCIFADSLHCEKPEN